MNNEELHQRTLEVLTTLVPILNCEDLALICWHCGIQPNELMPVEVPTYPTTYLKEIRNECTA